MIWALGFLAAPLAIVWGALAIRFSNLPGEELRTVLAWAFAVGFGAALAFVPGRKRTLLVLAAATFVLAVWWASIAPSHDRDWEPEYARVPHAVVEGDRITIHDVRHFEYRSTDDFDVRYETRVYELSSLRTLDFILSKWGPERVGHTMLSFGFEGGEYLALSAETRRERGEAQTALRGLFKQYELIFILADERDVLRLRTNFRGEDVYVYPTVTTPDQARTVLLELLKRTNAIYERPQFYNSIVHNCTTALVPIVRTIGRAPRDLRLLLNGATDQMGLENGFIASDLSLEDARARYHATPRAVRDADPARYSRIIRPDLD